MKRTLSIGMASLALACGGEDGGNGDRGTGPDAPPAAPTSSVDTFYFYDFLSYGVDSLSFDRDLDYFLLGGNASSVEIVEGQKNGYRQDLKVTVNLPYPRDDGRNYGSVATSAQFQDLVGDSGVFITRHGAFESLAAAEETLGSSEVRMDGFVFYMKLKLTWNYTNENISRVPITCNLLMGRYYSTDGILPWRWVLAGWGGHEMEPRPSDHEQGLLTCDGGKQMAFWWVWLGDDEVYIWPQTTGG